MPGKDLPALVAEARRVNGILSPGARLVMSFLKEGGVALALPEVAYIVKPDLPGIPDAPGARITRRFLPDGGLLPALERDQRWVYGLMLARAVVFELETLGCLVRVEVRGGSVTEKWSITDLGSRILRLFSVHEWRRAAGKRRAE